MEEIRIFPRSSAFEVLLAKVYLELWELEDRDPGRFAKRVQSFVTRWLPSMFQEKISAEMPDFERMVAELEDRIGRLEAAKASTDPLTADAIDTGSIPEENAEFAGEVWHAVVDVLTKAGFNFPLATAKPRRYMRP